MSIQKGLEGTQVRLLPSPIGTNAFAYHRNPR